MSPHPQSRRDAARARAAERKLAEQAAARRARAAARYGMGPLRDRVVRPRTLQQYKKAVKDFYKWQRVNGLVVPSTVLEFDTLLTHWVECIYSEGESKALLANALSGLAHLVPALKGRLNASWRLYHTWCRTEPVKQAPPLTVAMAQCMAGAFVEMDEPEIAVLVLLAHHCVLRTNEMLDLRSTDASSIGARILLVLRETKIGQRIGIHQEVAIKDPWLVPRVRWLLLQRPKGALLLPCTPDRFRKLWAKARRRCLLPREYTPYSLRRGGATCQFQLAGSFAKVAERGRWTSERAVRIYVNKALADMAADSGSAAWTSLVPLTKLLHRLPSEG